jgi:hypothetical protein
MADIGEAPAKQDVSRPELQQVSHAWLSIPKLWAADAKIEEAMMAHCRT